MRVCFTEVVIDIDLEGKWFVITAVAAASIEKGTSVYASSKRLKSW